MGGAWRLRQAVFSAIVLALVAGCSHDDGGSPSTDNSEPNVGIAPVSNKLRYESGVGSDRSTALNEAVSALYAEPIKPENIDGLGIMHLTDSSPQALQGWMEDRVQYVVNDDFDIESRAHYTRTFSFDSPDTRPSVLSASDCASISATTHDGSSVQVMMLNIGAAVYGCGKINSKLATVQLDGIGPVEMTSPRVGLLQIGAGLFPDLNGNRVQNIALDIFRAGILFHEARHSDGSGKTMGFLHATCPSDMPDYHGKAACDYATNGPYTVGANLIKMLMNSCSNCTDRTHNILEKIYLDQADRVLYSQSDEASSAPDAPAGQDWSDSPEGHR